MSKEPKVKEFSEFRRTSHWLLKNSKDQYICHNDKIKQNIRFAVLYDTKKLAIEGRGKRRSYNLVENISITRIDQRDHPRVVVTSEQLHVEHKD